VAALLAVLLAACAAAVACAPAGIDATARLTGLRPTTRPATVLGREPSVRRAGRSPGRGRLLRRRLRVGAARPRVPAGRPPARTALPSRSQLACLLAGGALALLVGGAVGLGVGACVAVAGPRLLARLEPEAERSRRRQLVADLPLALDLLAACLVGGAALPSAARAVAAAVPGPCGERLAAVAAALAVGSPPTEAWMLLAPGGEDDPLGPAARALARAADGGAPVAAAVGRLAERARADARGRGEQAARQAGVLAVAPLGLCFLPAFVLLGVVPVVAGLAGPLLAGLK